MTTNGQLVIPLEFSGLRTVQDFQSVLDKAETAHTESPWWIGDVIVEAEKVLGEDEWSSLLTGSNKVYYHISRRFPKVTRVTSLSHKHHKMVFSRKFKDSAMDWLNLADENGWSANDLRKAIKESQIVDGKVEPTTEDEAEANGKPTHTVPVSKTVDEILEENPPAPTKTPADALLKQFESQFGKTLRMFEQVASKTESKGTQDYSDARVHVSEFLAITRGMVQ